MVPAPMHARGQEAADGPPAWRARRRWLVVGLLFLVTVISYVDRQTMSIAAPVIALEFRLSNSDVALIVNAFLVAYAVGQLFAGRFMDWVGARTGFTLAVIAWSTAAALTSAGRSVFTFSLYRAALGLAEGGNFPGGVKVVAEWFHPRERSTAVGIFTSGASIGAIVTPPLMAYLIVTFGWRFAFIATALPGFAWIALWRYTYRPMAVSDEADGGPRRALAPKNRGVRGETSTAVRWSFFLKQRMVWGVFLARFVEEPVSWFYLTWLPIYMRDYRDVSIMNIGLLLVIPFVTLDIGYVAGGWIASRLMKAGWSVDRARKTVMVVSAICMATGIPAVAASGTAGFIAWVSVATLGHGGWASNVITLPSDFTPSKWVGTVYGMTAFGGGLGSILFMQLTGMLVDAQQSFQTVFLMAGILPIVAALVILTVTGPIAPLRMPTQPAAAAE